MHDITYYNKLPNQSYLNFFWYNTHRSCDGMIRNVISCVYILPKKTLKVNDKTLTLVWHAIICNKS